MPEGDVYTNTLFPEDNLASITSHPDWALDDEAAEHQTILQEVIEKARPVLEGGANEPETEFYLLGPIFHHLGFMTSVSEWIPYSETSEERTQVDFTLFKDAETFSGIVSERGTSRLFQGALAIVESVSFRSELDGDEDDVPNYLSNKLNRLLIINAVNWGIGTNGETWRLYNRQASADTSCFYEVDLLEAIRGDLETWKWFWFFFRKNSYVGSKGLLSNMDKLLA